MEDVITIAARKRDVLGKALCRKLRKEGKVPGNIIGQKNCQAIELDGKFLSKAWTNGKQLNLKLDGKTKLMRIQELQLHPVKRQALHVDLMV